jgi:riboflavin synthase alpha subunit
MTQKTKTTTVRMKNFLKSVTRKETKSGSIKTSLSMIRLKNRKMTMTTVVRKGKITKRSTNMTIRSLRKNIFTICLRRKKELDNLMKSSSKSSWIKKRDDMKVRMLMTAKRMFMIQKWIKTRPNSSASIYQVMTIQKCGKSE